MLIELSFLCEMLSDSLFEEWNEQLLDEYIS